MASNSGDSQEHHGSLLTGNKLGVLILGSEWESSKGGLSTINREFAIHLAKHSKVHVTFYVPQCNDGDKSAANAQNIDLREAQRVPGMDKLLWLSVPPHDLPIDVVVGHGAKLGPQAKAIKMIRGNCRWVQFVHTAPEELGMHKDYPNPISNGQEKHGIEVELCENADFVVTVGPKLNEAFRCYLSSCKTDQNVFCLTPGLFSEFSEVVQVPERSGNFQVLLFGRGDAEDFLLKGFDIAAEAIALLTNTHLIFVGATEGEQDDTAKRFLDRNIPTEALHVRSFSNRECLKKIFYEVDLAIMPSRTEGFGLTGLEALSAGLPILVSHNSGFGEALSKVRFGSYSLVKSNEASSWSDAIKDVMGKSRELRLEESKALRESYEKRYSWEEQIEELVQKMITLVYGPDLECQSVTKQSITSPQSLVSTEDQQGTVPIEFRLKQVTYKDDISRDSGERVMKEMARRFLEEIGEGIPLEEWPKSLSYYINGMLDLKKTKASEGSLRISVECRTLPILERLWEDYRCGHLNEVAEKRLLTDDIKEKFSVESVKLETIILEEDYLACKLFLMDTSKSTQSGTTRANEEQMIEVRTEADGEETQSSEGPDPRTLYLEVNCGGFPNMNLPEKVLETESADISVNEFPEYLKSVRLIQNSRQQGANEQTVWIAVECHSLEILESLWRDFCSGHLNAVAEKMLLTDDIKERFHVESISLQTTILEEDYLACKEFLLANTKSNDSSSQCENETRTQADKETQVQSADEARTKAVEEAQLHLVEEPCTLFPVPSTEQTKVVAAEETQIHSAGETWVQDVEETKGEYDKARESCMAVLEQDPENEEGRNILERVDSIIKEKDDETKGKKRGKKKKESEEIKKTILAKIQKDQEKLQQRNEQKCDEIEEGKPLPSFDVTAALDASGSGRKTADKPTSVQEYTKVNCNENDDVPRKTSRGSQRTNLSQQSQLGSNPAITTDVSNLGSNLSQGTQEILPKDVVRLCQHFMNDRKIPSCCFSCSKNSKFEYGIWRSTKRKWQLIRPYPRDVNVLTPFRICWHYINGSECVPSCKFAHGEEELNLWSTRRQADHNSSREHANPQDHHFDLNRQPQERIHGSLIINDTRQSRPRSPPIGVYSGNYKLCKWWKSGRVCRTGRFCTFAHGQQELKSWIEHAKMDPPATNTEATTAEKSSGETAEKAADTLQSEMVYSLPGVQVSTDKPSVVQLSLRGDETRHTYEWEFTITFEIGEVGMLKQIDLTHGYYDCYRLTRIRGFLNNKEIFSREPREWRTYSLPTGIERDAKSGQMKVDVSISFETPALSSNRTFTQCVRFDFGKKPFLLHGLNVDVESKEGLDEISATREAVKLDASVWTKGSVEVVAWSESAAVSNLNGALQDRFQLPPRIENVVSAQVIDKDITAENYQRTMHQLLFTEELFMKKALSRFILCEVPLDCRESIFGERTGMVFAANGQLFGVLTPQTNGTPQPDDAAGRLLIRNVKSAWLKLAANSSQKVYEALIEKVDNASIVLKLSSQMCSDLQLTNNGLISVDVQFQLNRQPLCEWHAAIDRLGSTQRSLLFPEQSASQEFHEQPLTSRNSYSAMDPSQIKVVGRILEPESNSPPLVVFGPFGTGKTFTLHQAIRELVTRRNKRILLCTHTNSAADLHVQLLHEYLTTQNGLKAAKPLRIYHTWRRLDADSSVAKKYALIANNAYVLPTREDVIKHRVVITTLATSQHLLQLQLNHGFFTHILVDEAAQALEPEALIPLALAGPNTKVVFTGDHMQMKPEVYSSLARDWGLQRSLPERLFDYYHEKQTSLDRNVMFLTRNYRCHPEILQFPSDNFYGNGLNACSVEAAHPTFGPLLFFSTTGVEEAIENSYINTAETSEVVKRVKELCDDWPVEWAERDLSKIGVISAYMPQVQAIRRLLRNERGELGNVTVESIYNVQGKEFRAVLISTVRTSLTCHDFNSSGETPSSKQQVYWEFLSDATLLNTAITRAKSLVAVIGDPVSLCTVGECRGNWRDYIKRCNDRKALYGTSYEELNRKINASLYKISLNPLASNFVPKSKKEAIEQECESGEECDIQQDKGKRDFSGLEGPKGKDQESLTLLEAEDVNNVMTNNRNEFQTFGEELMKEESPQESKNDEQEESESLIDFLENENESESGSQDGDNNSQLCYQENINHVQETSAFFDEFRREIFEDETVFPRYMDKIIAALVEKCQESKERDAAFPSLQAAKVSKRNTFRAEKSALLPVRQEKPSFSGNLSSTDYQIIHVNGRTKTRLVNLDFQHSQSSRVQRLTTISRQDDYLDAEILQRYLLTAPEIYVPCTLRLSSESFRSVYGVVSDTKTPDIKIKGRVRGVFDMDRVVIKKIPSGPSCRDDALVSRGKILGVLSHIISPHERQYVCRVDYENPELMLPINKSVSKIVTLTAKDVKGMPIYKELRDGDDDKLRVEVMDLAEFRSGKCLFLVQYLQWRSDCTYPLGIIIRKLPQVHTVSSSMEILFAEHGIRKSFPEESMQDVYTKFPVTWSIPEEENQNREKIDGAFTVDPEGSKDLDDALTVEQLPESVYRIGVHIADVSYFVEEGTSLDKDAFFRSTSYYPGDGYESVPMLPPELSENHCSLLPDKDRLSLSVFFDLSKGGRLLGQPTFQRTIVRSCCRLSYRDAQKIINGQDLAGRQIPADTARKIQALSLLAQRRRVLRLGHAAFDHWSNSDHDPESFEAQEMVEEMMILVNEETAKFLCAEIPVLVPLRTQLPPKDHRLSDWVQQYGQFMPYSLYLRGLYSKEALRKMAKEGNISGAKEFKVQRSIWSEICDAEVTENHSKLQFLICNDGHHPQLTVANSQFRAIQQKSQYMCKEEQVGESVLHFSLGMACYTHFTSPIRRYIDIQVHRLLLNLILTGCVAQEHSKEKVAKVCRRSTFARDNSRKFDKATTKVHIAANLRSNNHDVTKAVVASIEDQAITLEILNQDYKDLSRRQRRIKLGSLNPFKVDVNDDGSNITFTWKQRIYLVQREGEARESLDEKEEVKRLLSQGQVEKGEVVDLPGGDWRQILKALLEENYVQLGELIRKTNRQMRQHSTPNDKRADENNMDYVYDKTLSLRRFDVVNIQLSANMTHGVLHPEIQLFKISPSVNICIEHRKYPRRCFATTSRSPASRKKYSSVESYIHAWEPVLAMEAATGAVDESDEFTIYNVEVQWTKKGNGDIEGSFHLHEDYCSEGQIYFFEGDFVCIRVREDHYLTDRNLGTIANDTEGNSNSEPSIAHHDLSSVETNSRYDTWSSFWVGHCIIRHIKKPSESLDEPCSLEVKMDLHQSSSDFPEALITAYGHCSTLNVVQRSLPHRRMLSALRSRLPNASHLIQAICMGHDPPQEEFGEPPSSNLSIVRKHPMSAFKPLNAYQEKSVKEALTKPFTLVQGPPGTGKTVTGVHMAYWFTKQNTQSQQTDEDSNASPQVLYCGPSNKSVDVVAIKMLRIPDVKILRVYGDRKEEAVFPIPNKRKPLKLSADDEFEIKDDGLRAVSLHHVIRGQECPYASDLRDYDRKFEEDRKKGVRTEDSEVESYRTKIDEAKKWALTSSGVQIILCTCATAGSPRIIECCKNIQQCIVDECGMCLEPESLVPLTSSKARQVVMIGDHKQLQPVIQDQLAKTLGLNISMFERLSKRAVMLELQYRMHYGICQFPSQYFYNGKLQTDPSVSKCDPRLQSFWPPQEGETLPIAFCHLEGEEETSAIKTSQSNEQSQANMKEVRKVVHVARHLILKRNVDPGCVVVLTPYREQRSRIQKELQNVYPCKDIDVKTIIKSQGSEWDYVILSLVRSTKTDELDPDPSLSWLREHLGFLTDEHQINVGLTRARKGLCIIGNKNLLKHHPMWKKLLAFYEENRCLVNGSNWPTN